MNSKPARVASPIPPIFPSTSPSTSPASHRRAKRPRRARVPSSPGLNRRRAMALASPASRPLRKQHARAHHVSLARRIPIDRSIDTHPVTRVQSVMDFGRPIVRLSDCPIVRLSDRRLFHLVVVSVSCPSVVSVILKVHDSRDVRTPIETTRVTPSIGRMIGRSDG